MAFQKVYKGGTFGPNMKFPEYCLFENCTFLAQCTFGDHCHFISCNFQKCCPKPYSNPNSEVGSGSILVDCTLEYVTIPKDALLKNPKEKERVINKGRVNPKPVKKAPEPVVLTNPECKAQQIDGKDKIVDKWVVPCGKSELVSNVGDAEVTTEQPCGCK